MFLKHFREYVMPPTVRDGILAATPNTETLIWVDFSVQDVFPPDPSKGDRVPPME